MNKIYRIAATVALGVTAGLVGPMTPAHADTSCLGIGVEEGETQIVGTTVTTCTGGRFVPDPCNGQLNLTVLPLVLKPGTSITCDEP